MPGDRWSASYAILDVAEASEHMHNHATSTLDGTWSRGRTEIGNVLCTSRISTNAAAEVSGPLASSAAWRLKSSCVPSSTLELEPPRQKSILLAELVLTTGLRFVEPPLIGEEARTYAGRDANG